MKKSKSTITDPMANSRNENKTMKAFINRIEKLLSEQKKQDKKEAKQTEKNMKSIKSLFDENKHLKQELTKLREAKKSKTKELKDAIKNNKDKKEKKDLKEQKKQLQQLIKQHPIFTSQKEERKRKIKTQYTVKVLIYNSISLKGVNSDYIEELKETTRKRKFKFFFRDVRQPNNEIENRMFIQRYRPCSISIKMNSEDYLRFHEKYTFGSSVLKKDTW